MEYLVLLFLVDFYFTSGGILVQDIIGFKFWTRVQVGFEKFFLAKVEFQSIISAGSTEFEQNKIQKPITRIRKSTRVAKEDRFISRMDARYFSAKSSTVISLCGSHHINQKQSSSGYKYPRIQICFIRSVRIRSPPY